MEERVLPGDYFFTGALFEYARQSGPIRKAIIAVLDEWFDALKDAVDGARRRGDIDKEVDPGRRHGLRQVAKGPANQPKWDDYSSKSNDLRALLDRSGDVFSSWRYIYEFTEPDQGNYQFHHFEYGLLLSASHAIQTEIKRTPGILPENPGP